MRQQTTVAKKKQDKDRHRTPRRQVALPVDLVAQVEECAQRHERPLGWEIARVLRWYVENGCRLPSDTEGDA
jgi:hypothetical protein